MTGQIQELAGLIQRHHPITLLSGAGISAASGLPVYRDTEGNWVHSKPMEGPVFRSDDKARQRYWCRSFFGWPSFSKAIPNTTHKEIALLESSGCITTTITQNVDGLHQRAGSTGTIALHGNLSEVVCLNCENLSSRDELQLRLARNNPDHTRLTVNPAPDGDAIIDDSHIASFKVVNCARCGGLLKPNVVFFGDNVPKARVQLCMDNLSQSKLLLCVGTSLMVYSGYRFCKAANDENIPIVIVNDGSTRADALATMRIGGNCADVLTQLRQLLS